MTDQSGSDSGAEKTPRSKFVKALQSIGAVLVTLFALWFLFGVPAYLLFGIFFE